MSTKKTKNRRRPTLHIWATQIQNLPVCIELRAGKKKYRIRATAAMPDCELHRICPASISKRIDTAEYKARGWTRGTIVAALMLMVMNDLCKALNELEEESGEPGEADQAKLPN